MKGGQTVWPKFIEDCANNDHVTFLKIWQNGTLFVPKNDAWTNYLGRSSDLSAHKHSKQKECLALYGIINWASQNNNQQNAHQINPSLSIRNCSSTNKKNQHDFGAEQCVIQ